MAQCPRWVSFVKTEKVGITNLLALYFYNDKMELIIFMPLYIFGQGQGEFLNRALECISPRLGFKEYYPNQMLGVVVTGLILLQELRLVPSLEQLSKESSSSKFCPKKRGNTVLGTRDNYCGILAPF